ncbi:MAG: HEAT repeat domain-containing protein, partial [Myxococcota bacterium]
MPRNPRYPTNVGTPRSIQPQLLVVCPSHLLQARISPVCWVERCKRRALWPWNAYRTSLFVFGLFWLSILGGCHDPNTVAGNVQLLQHRYPMERQKAAERLGRMGQKAWPAVPTLCQRLALERNAEIRLEIAKSLGELKHSKAIPTLIQAFQDTHQEVRIAAAYALGKIGKKAVPFLHRMLKKPIAFEKGYYAVSALGRMGIHALPTLRMMLRSPSDKLRQKATEALKAIGPPAVPHLLYALQDQRESIQAYAAWAMMKIGIPGFQQFPTPKQRMIDALLRKLSSTSDKT